MAKLFSDRRGVTAVEYALLAGVVCLALFAVLKEPAHALGDLFAQILTASNPISVHH